MEKTLTTSENTRRALSPSCLTTRAAGFERRTKRRLMSAETKANVSQDQEQDQEDEEEVVKEKISTLQRIIPGGTELGVDALFEETAGYIMSLQCQIKTIKVLTSFLQRLDKQDMKFGG